MMKLSLYGTSACHLCEEAALLLNSLSETHHFSFIEIDIIESELLIMRYGTKIPVLLLESTKEELFWPFSSDDICTFIA